MGSWHKFRYHAKPMTQLVFSYCSFVLFGLKGSFVFSGRHSTQVLKTKHKLPKAKDTTRHNTLQGDHKRGRLPVKHKRTLETYVRRKAQSYSR